MLSSRTRSVRELADRAAAGAIVAAMVASFVPATLIAYGSWTRWWDALTPPIFLTSAEALWIGLLASNLFVLQVVLLARLPWLERVHGRAALTAWHRRLAYWSFWLTLLHVVLFVNQRAGRRPQSFGESMLQLFVTDPWMLVATIGTVLIVLVVLSSIAVAMRRLRYETWHLTHLWSYVGIALALPHQLISEDFNRAGALAYWWALYLLGVGLLLGFRVLLPAWRSLRHDLRIETVVTEGPDAVSVVVTGRGLDRWGARAGQFFVWRFVGPTGSTRGHPYSLSAAPEDDRLRVTIGGTGDGAVRARRLEPGARVVVEGPYGALPWIRRRHPRLVLFAAGIGITPVRALLEAPELAGTDVTVIARFSSAEQAVLLEEVERIAEARGFVVHAVLGPRAGENRWWGSEASATTDPVERMRRLVPDIADADIVLCGPSPWTAQVRRTVEAAGAHRRDVHEEQFTW